MSQKVKGNTIIMTRGDTLKVKVNLSNKDGTPYTPQEGDTIRFACKQDYGEYPLLIRKEVPTDTMLLKLEPSDTKELSFGDYVYDIEITFANGDVDTFVDRGTLRLTEEVV